MQQSGPLIHIEDNATGKVLLEYTPLPHQRLYHESSAVNLLLRGGRGSGKSFCMRMDAHIRALQYPNFKYLILRRKMPELRQSHLIYIDREMRCLGGYYNKTEAQAHYSNSSIGFFGHVENNENVLNYLSSEYDLRHWNRLSGKRLEKQKLELRLREESISSMAASQELLEAGRYYALTMRVQTVQYSVFFCIVMVIINSAPLHAAGDRASLLFVLAFALLMLAVVARMFALRSLAQRTEEEIHEAIRRRLFKEEKSS